MKDITVQEIKKVENTTDTLSSRGGLAFFVKYLNATNIYSLLLEQFSGLKKTKKGTCVGNLLKQILCFFFDGTSFSLSYFDHLANDPGYAAVIENEPPNMASSHTMKRFFKAFGNRAEKPFRWILHHLFIWRLKLQAPKQVVLTIDTMVMDNDQALKRQGCDPTYKKKKGFQPLQIIWNGYIVDAIFRRGKKHSNFGKQPAKMLEDLAVLIREKYRFDVPIIVRMDSGFLDEQLFELCNEMAIGFIASGKIYQWVKDQVQSIDPKKWKHYDNGKQLWSYASFRYGCKSWSNDYRALYTRPLYEGDQELLEFARPDNVIFTNLEKEHVIWDYLSEEQKAYWTSQENLIENHHQRGADELPHRAFKEFGCEQLPFQKFGHNRAYYYMMLISFFLFESFKEDGLAEVMPVKSYAKKVRREFVDMAVKVIKKGRQTILKVTAPYMEKFNLIELFKKCQNFGKPILQI